MTAKPSVLIVDQQEETREVLRTALESRGMQIFAAEKADDGLQLARQHRPDLIVLDLELASGNVEQTATAFQAEGAKTEAPLVLLGTARRTVSGAGREFVAKPYHYAPLIRRIEELLDEGGLARAG